MEEVLELAEQSKLKLTDEEIEVIKKEIDSLNSNYEVLESVDTEGIEPLFSVLEDKVSNRFLKDEVKNISEVERQKIFDRDKMLDDFYQVQNKEGN